MSINVTYNKNIPDGPNNPSVDQPKMKVNTNAVDQILAVDHVSFNANGGGWHKQVTFASNNVPPIPSGGVTPPVLFTKDVQAAVTKLPQLFYYSGKKANTQDQYLVTGTSVGDEGSTYLFGGIIIKWSDTSAKDGGKSVTFTKAFPNQCFVVLLTSRDQNFTGELSVSDVSVSGFKAWRNSGSGSTGVSYIAIGN